MSVGLVIFGYNRPEHLQNCLDAIANSPYLDQLDTYIYLDGPRSQDDVAKVAAVRQIATAFKKRNPCEIRHSDLNIGLSKSILTGVSNVLKTNDSVIVLEDDIQATDAFFKFCLDGLSKFKKDDRVASIHGYRLPLEAELDEPFFLRGADCWGWATWRDRWNQIELDSNVLLAEFGRRGPRETAQFNFNGSINYLDMLKQQSKGLIDSWAIRWHASMFLAGKLTLYPPVSLVKNTGLDGSGTHFTEVDSSHDVELRDQVISLDGLKVIESPRARDLVSNFHNRQRPKGAKSLLRRALHRLQRLQ